MINEGYLHHKLIALALPCDKCTCPVSLNARSDFCPLSITIANSENPDQDRQNIGHDLDPNHLTVILFLKEFFENVKFEKSQQTTTKA